MILSFHVIFVLSVLSPIVCATRAKFLKKLCLLPFYHVKLGISLWYFGHTIIERVISLFDFYVGLMVRCLYPVFHLDILKYNLNDIIIGNVDKKAINWLLWPNCSPGSIFWVDFFWPASMKGILEDFLTHLTKDHMRFFYHLTSLCLRTL